MSKETLAEYFSRPTSPAEHSPVGLLMAKILPKFPGISFDDARAKAKNLLIAATGKQRFLLPRVRSEQEEAKERARLEAYRKPKAEKPSS